MKKLTSLINCAVILLCAGTSFSAKQTMWSIGQKDKSGKDLGLERNHERFAREITKDFTYRIGQDSPTKWPYIHAGPVDRWAGETTHPLPIRFDVQEIPGGLCALVVNTLGTYNIIERMTVSINGNSTVIQLPAGPGDPALHDEAKAKPETTRIEFSPTLLKKGENEITVTISEGAWVLYDSIELEVDDSAKATALSDFKLEATPCFTTGSKGLMQVVRARLHNRGNPQPFSVRVKNGGASGGVESAGAPGSLSFGANTFDIPVPEVNQPTTYTVTLKSGDESLEAAVAVAPQRKWKIFCQPSIHTDIGYTHRQDEVFHRHNTNLDKVVEMCRTNPLFEWSIEVAWEVQNYFNDRTPEQQQKLIGLVQEGRLGLNAGYLNLLTALMSDEAMNHYAYYAAGLRRKYNVPSYVSLMTDIPSATRALVPAMAGSGVRYFSEGCNQDRGPTIRHSGIRSPFYWEGVDGSRVLTWLSEGYAQSSWLAQAPDVNALYDHVSSILRGYESFGDKFPYDAIYQYGAFLDNWEVDQRYGSLLKDWNAKYAYPQIIISAGPEWFEYLEKNFKDKIEVRKQDFGAYWEDGAGSTQQETIIHMDNMNRITTAEMLWSLARLRGVDAKYPMERFTKAWDDILLYAEHTWGAAQSISAPDDPMTIDQWKYKADYAHRPAKELRALEKEGMEHYLKTVQAKSGDVVVFNPSSWKRSGAVTLPNADARTVWVSDVPALGSKVLTPDEMKPKLKSNTTANPTSVENDHYRIELSKERGITSIKDKATGAELVNSSEPYGFGQVVYASGGEGTRMIHPDRGPFAKVELNTTDANPLEPAKESVLVTPAKITGVEVGETKNGVWQEIVIRSTAAAMPDIKTAVRLHTKEKRISFDVAITSKTEIRKKEAVYVAFPFAGGTPQFRFGMVNAIQNPHKDFAKGACHEWYCVTDFVSCATTGNGTEVVWTAPDAPLVCLSEINKGRWISEPELTTATIFSYAMNNYWHTNYKAGQGGDFHFRYHITSGKPGISNEQCIRFARETAKPLIPAVYGGGKSIGTGDAISVEGKGVVVTTIAGAQDDKGTVIRLRNTEETPTQAKVNLPETLTAELVTLVEDPNPEKPDRTNGTIHVKLGPQQVQTLRVR